MKFYCAVLLLVAATFWSEALARPQEPTVQATASNRGLVGNIISTISQKINTGLQAIKNLVPKFKSSTTTAETTTAAAQTTTAAPVTPPAAAVTTPAAAVTTPAAAVTTPAAAQTASADSAPSRRYAQTPLDVFKQLLPFIG